MELERAKKGEYQYYWTLKLSLVDGNTKVLFNALNYEGWVSGKFYGGGTKRQEIMFEEMRRFEKNKDDVVIGLYPKRLVHTRITPEHILLRAFVQPDRDWRRDDEEDRREFVLEKLLGICKEAGFSPKEIREENVPPLKIDLEKGCVYFTQYRHSLNKLL